MSHHEVPPAGCPICFLDDPDVTVHADALVQALGKLHVIARYRDDSVRIEWNGREQLGHAARADVATAIRAQLVQAR